MIFIIKNYQIIIVVNYLKFIVIFIVIENYFVRFLINLIFNEFINDCFKYFLDYLLFTIYFFTINQLKDYYYQLDIFFIIFLIFIAKKDFDIRQVTNDNSKFINFLTNSLLFNYFNFIFQA